jgi:Ca2+-binding EF-hand superfamily protein
MRFVGFAALVAAAVPATALAQPAAKPAEDAKPISRIAISDKLDADYADLDADKDGKATTEEINARLMKTAEADLAVLKKARDDAFAKLDTDGDGSISKAEFEAKAALPTIKEPNAQPFLNRFDANKDGSISKDEFRAPTLANFEKMDSNKDGTLSAAEQKAPPRAAAKKKPTFKSTPAINR